MDFEIESHDPGSPVERGLAVLRALADPSRLAVVGALSERPHCLEELTERLGRAASTLSFHLRRLEEAGLVTKARRQYYVVYELRSEVLEWRLREVVAGPGEPGPEQKRARRYREQVLRTFFRRGVLVQLPRQRRKRLVVLEELLPRFEPGRRYAETEITDLLTPVYADYCTLRRLLVDEGYLQREGGTYWLAEKEPPTMKDRKELVREYKERPRKAGIFQVRNLENGKVLLGSTRNLHGPLNRHRFMLGAGSHPNADLQRDWKELGPDAFAFEVLAEIEPRDDPSFSVEDELVKLEQAWVAKVRPFGSRGYNRSPSIRD